MARPSNLRKFKFPLITNYFLHISVYKITLFYQTQAKLMQIFLTSVCSNLRLTSFCRFPLLTRCKNKRRTTINCLKTFADHQNHINGIEIFWNQAKHVLRKYNGINRKSFPLFLKECEFRFNFGTPSQQLKILRDWCGI